MATRGTGSRGGAGSVMSKRDGHMLSTKVGHT